jgi:hypothetical protein
MNAAPGTAAIGTRRRAALEGPATAPMVCHPESWSATADAAPEKLAKVAPTHPHIKQIIVRLPVALAIDSGPPAVVFAVADSRIKKAAVIG